MKQARLSQARARPRSDKPRSFAREENSQLKNADPESRSYEANSATQGTCITTPTGLPRIQIVSKRRSQDEPNVGSWIPNIRRATQEFA